MTDKIREAFENWESVEFEGAAPKYCDDAYKAGYIAGRQSLLEELEPYGIWCEANTLEESDYYPQDMSPGICEQCIPLYRLPEGVTK